jgi:hypothetical protein
MEAKPIYPLSGFAFFMEKDLKEEKDKKEYPLVDLLGKNSLKFISKLAGKDYKRTPKGKGKIIRKKSSMGTFQFKLLMEEIPKGKLYGR